MVGKEGCEGVFVVICQGTGALESLVAAKLPRPLLTCVSMVSQSYGLPRLYPLLEGCGLQYLLERNKPSSHSPTCASLNNGSYHKSTAIGTAMVKQGICADRRGLLKARGFLWLAL